MLLMGGMVMKKNPLKIVAAAIGNCVHVAGSINFLNLAQQNGYKTKFLGPAVSISELLLTAKNTKADIIGVSYRLDPNAAHRLFELLKSKATELGLINKCQFICGCTPAVAAKARKFNFFTHVFDGSEQVTEIMQFLNGEISTEGEQLLGSDLLTRLKNKKPYPLLRHHFGLPKVEDTIKGIEKIAKSKVLDIISIGPDQNAQFSFFRPKEMDSILDGGGGVEIRTKEHMIQLYQAAQKGNYPLLRCYSGTRDLKKWAKLNATTINNAWAAIPLCWYSVLDGRSNRTLVEAIIENQSTIAWHAKKNIPVEVNESHHWSLRHAPDVIAVVMAYLAAYNAKSLGVKNYVAQYMLNTPYGTHYNMDIAKMLAKISLINSLHDANFQSIKQVRTGLASLSTDLNIAKGQLASSIHLAMSLDPDIVHVVGFSEANHAAKPEDVIESCKIVQGVINNTLNGLPYVALDPVIFKRKKELLKEAKVLLAAISNLASGSKDPLTDPHVIAKAIKIGLLDAPHLRGNSYTAGKIYTSIVNGKCLAIDKHTQKPLTEQERITKLIDETDLVVASS